MAGEQALGSYLAGSDWGLGGRDKVSAALKGLQAGVNSGGDYQPTSQGTAVQDGGMAAGPGSMQGHAPAPTPGLRPSSVGGHAGQTLILDPGRPLARPSPPAFQNRLLLGDGAGVIGGQRSQAPPGSWGPRADPALSRPWLRSMELGLGSTYHSTYGGLGSTPPQPETAARPAVSGGLPKAWPEADGRVSSPLGPSALATNTGASGVEREVMLNPFSGRLLDLSTEPGQEMRGGYPYTTLQGTLQMLQAHRTSTPMAVW